MNKYTSYKGIDIFNQDFDETKSKKFCLARLNIHGKYDICPFCKKKIKDGAITLLFNNFKLFPNIIVHTDCCNQYQDKQDLVEFLTNDYNEYLDKEHWF